MEDLVVCRKEENGRMDANTHYYYYYHQQGALYHFTQRFDSRLKKEHTLVCQKTTRLPREKKFCTLVLF